MLSIALFLALYPQMDEFFFPGYQFPVCPQFKHSVIMPIPNAHPNDKTDPSDFNREGKEIKFA